MKSRKSTKSIKEIKGLGVPQIKKTSDDQASRLQESDWISSQM
jgi:hypothetical protein